VTMFAPTVVILDHCGSWRMLFIGPGSLCAQFSLQLGSRCHTFPRARPAFSCHQTYLLRSSVCPLPGRTSSAIVSSAN
jgi:hypothetical protein